MLFTLPPLGLIFARSFLAWVVFCFSLLRINRRLLNLLFNEKILDCPDDKLRNACVVEMSDQMMILQLVTGTASSFLITGILSDTELVIKGAWALVGLIVLAYAVYTHLTSGSLTRLRDLLGKDWPRWCALAAALATTMAAVLP
jgi:hypothetical protein